MVECCDEIFLTLYGRAYNIVGTNEQHFCHLLCLACFLNPGCGIAYRSEDLRGNL